MSLPPSHQSQTSPDDDKDESSTREEVETAGEVFTAIKGCEVSGKRVDTEGKNASEKVWETNCRFKHRQEAVKVNQICCDKHSRCEDGREDCSNDESDETTGEGDENNCDDKSNTAEYVEGLLGILEVIL